MQYFLELINSIVKDPQASQTIFVIITATAAFAFVMSLGFLLSAFSDPARKRLTAITQDKNAAATASVGDDFFKHIMGTAASALLPSNNQDKSHIQKQLIIAGFRSNNAVTNFYAYKTILAVGLPLAVLMLSRFSVGISTQNVIVATLLAFSAGVMLPNYVLKKLVDKRQRKLRAAFPDALDLLVVCVESGLGLTSAIARVAQELDITHPELAADLALINKEIMVGVPRSQAFKNLSERTGLNEIRGLATLLDQSLRFGTSVADALRTYAEEFRDKRMQAAEEQAAKISTKLIFPLTAFIWPSFFVIAVGPAILQVLEAFK
ncbi:type II secretion system F family protein [Aestuariicella hydrocarbonica]|uniref:Type II secretion system F family protein n=1 Tax=Pseudomaricurvus hydrocarbonicus TaxID=1470433 RepID=A0A9E5MMV9_9GAMM|nr:type II secretion system F family protein [Aestuariicella hydrocarbonica]NHO67145.1 type II secretion system F family protein [Aestuariicella hydrocarbonica]